MSAPAFPPSVDRRSLVSYTEWEEPHPGHRLSGLAKPSGNNRGLDQSVQRLETDVKGTVGTLYGAASRGLYLTPLNSSGPDELPTIKTTANVPQAMVLPDNDSAISGSLVSESLSSDMTYQTVDVDIQMIDVDKLDSDGNPRSPSFLALTPVSEFEDLSSYLGDSPTSERWSSVIDNAPYTHTSPMEDIYGWDAEWDRRVASPPPVVVAPSSDFGSRLPSNRRGTGKGGLLQRVLSVGKAPSRTSTSRRARFNPS